MRITALVDVEALDPSDPQLEHGAGDLCMEMEFHVTDTARDLGHEVQVVAFGADIEATISGLRASVPDLVLNLTEHFRGNRRMDKCIAALLELMGFPYTGTGPSGLLLCRDKALSKRLLSHHRIRVPDFLLLPPGPIRIPRRLHYPMVVKPLYEDGSDGIALSSLVHNADELSERALSVHERMRQPVICEEFIDGRELYVGVIGNRRLQALPARECRFNDPSTAAPRIATARVKHDPAYCRKWNIEFTDAQLDPALEARVAKISRRVFHLMHLRDYGRVDLRVSPAGDIVVLEVNPNPDLTMGDEVAEAAARRGISYDQLIARIIRQARRRYRT